MKQELKELREIITRLQVEVDDLKCQLDDANTEISNLEDAEPSYENSINLGLDTIHFTFEKGNLQIRQQFDSLMQVLNKTPNSVI